jgi:AbiTii
MEKDRSIVVQLQEEALDKGVPLADLLRKAFVVSRKLGLAEFQSWIENELNGYGKGVKVPDYRKVFGQVRGWNPYHGWQPIIFQDPKMGESLSHRYNSQSVAELESLVDGGTENSSFHMPFSQKIQRQLSKACGFETEVSLFSSRTEIIKILDSVRNIILNWALKLEEDGILGEGLTFTTKEKTTAATSEYNITNFFGPVNQPQLQQGAQTPIQIQANLTIDLDQVADFIGKLRNSIPEMNLPSNTLDEIKAEIATLVAQTTSPKPKQSILREGLRSIRSILEGAGGGAAAQLLIELGKMLF